MMLWVFHGTLPVRELWESRTVAGMAAGTSQCTNDLIHHRTISSVHAFGWDQASSNPSSSNLPKNHCNWRVLSGKIWSGLLWSTALQNNNTKAVQPLPVSFGMGGYGGPAKYSGLGKKPWVKLDGTACLGDPFSPRRDRRDAGWAAKRVKIWSRLFVEADLMKQAPDLQCLTFLFTNVVINST